MVKFLKTANIPYDTRPLCCEDCGHYSLWENWSFDPGDEEDEQRVDVTDLLDGVDYIIVDD